MGILEEIQPRRGMLEELENFLDSLDKKDRAEWDEVLRDSIRYTPAPIVAALKRRGVNVNVNAIYRYRNKMEAKRGK